MEPGEHRPILPDSKNPEDAWNENEEAIRDRLAATVGRTIDRPTGAEGVIFTTTDASVRLAYFPALDTMRLAVGPLRLSLDRPPAPQIGPERAAIVFEAADYFLAVSNTG